MLHFALQYSVTDQLVASILRYFGGQAEPGAWDLSFHISTTTRPTSRAPHTCRLPCNTWVGLCVMDVLLSSDLQASARPGDQG